MSLKKSPRSRGRNGRAARARFVEVEMGPAMKAEVLDTSDLQIDETPIDYLCPGRGSTKEGRLWVYRHAVSGTCYFDWQAGRGLDYLLDFLGYDIGPPESSYGATDPAYPATMATSIRTTSGIRGIVWPSGRLSGTMAGRI